MIKQFLEKVACNFCKTEKNIFPGEFLAGLLFRFLSKGRLPVKWTAYEALMFGTYTTQSDV